MEWALKVSDIIALFALLVASASFWLSYRTRKDSKAATAPLVRIFQTTAYGNTHEAVPVLRVQLRSRDNQGYTCTEARIFRPFRARIFRFGDAFANKPGGRYEFDPSLVKPARYAPVRLRVVHAGQEPLYSGAGNMRVAPGDTDHDDLLLSLSDELWSGAWRRLTGRPLRLSTRVLISFRIERDSDSKSFIVRKVLTVPPEKTSSAQLSIQA